MGKTLTVGCEPYLN